MGIMTLGVMLYLPAGEAHADTKPLQLVLGGEGSTAWSITNIKPGDSGIKTVTLQNAGTVDGMVTIWISDLVSVNGSAPDPKIAN